MFEPRSAQIVISAASRVVAFGKDAAFERAVEASGFVFFEGMKIVETAKEEKIRDLFDHFQRVGDATGPKDIPESVDLVFNFASNHEKKAKS